MWIWKGVGVLQVRLGVLCGKETLIERQEYALIERVLWFLR